MASCNCAEYKDPRIEHNKIVSHHSYRCVRNVTHAGKCMGEYNIPEDQQPDCRKSANTQVHRVG